MNKAGGYIAIHRQITEWEWYKDVNTKSLFLHLLVTANFTNTKFMGKVIKRGQVVTSLPSLALETGLSIQNVRTAIKHLISTGEITDKSNRQYRLITVVKYDDYQKPTDNLTVNQQTTNRQLTDNQQYHNKVNNANKGIKNKRVGAFAPPTLDEVKTYVQETGNKIDAEYFWNYYEARGWELGSGKKMANWKSVVQTWIRREKNERKPDEPKRPDYSKYFK